MLYEELKKRLEDIYNLANDKLKEVDVLQQQILKKEKEEKAIKNLQDKLKK